MEGALSNFVIGIVALEIGVMLIILYRKHPESENFVTSMTVLSLIMSAVSLTFPVLAEHKGFVYYFLPIYLLGVNGWVLVVKHFIYHNVNWQKDGTYKQTLVPWYMLMAGFFPGSIVFVIYIPHIPNLALP